MAAGFSKLVNAIELIKPSFEGRITFEEYTRAGFWLGLLSTVLIIIIVVLSLVAGINAKDFENASGGTLAILGLFSFVGGILLTIVWFSLMARRLHDVGYSANYLWLFLLCCVGGLVPIVLCLGDTVGDNEWGSGNNNHQGSNFSDLRKSLNYILHPESRLTLKEFTLASTILYWIYLILSNFCSTMEQFEKRFSGSVTLDSLSTLETADESLGVSDVLVLIVCIAYLVFYLRIAIPRLHDTGRSGHYWWLILGCFILAIIPIVMCYADSDDDNEYGPKREDDDGNSLGSDDSNGSNGLNGYGSNSFYSSNQSSRDECIE
ncbi:MAG: DUF805 domain-containing protein [Proteobacteria bacterium]|nr:DUF805 domain-containing protein [Pseudomonadota bacterium]